MYSYELEVCLMLLHGTPWSSSNFWGSVQVEVRTKSWRQFLRLGFRLPADVLALWSGTPDRNATKESQPCPRANAVLNTFNRLHKFSRLHQRHAGSKRGSISGAAVRMPPARRRSLPSPSLRFRF